MPVPTTTLLAASLLLSATSLSSRLIVWLPWEARERWLPWLQAVAVGLLLGDGLLHVLPHALESGIQPETLLVAVTAGVAFLVAVEGGVRAMRSSTTAPFARMTLVADFIHHLIDGVILAGAFTADSAAGWLSLVAIALHEVPREMGSAGVLVAGGYSPRRAFVLSIAMATAVPLGVLLLMVASGSSGLTPVLSAFAAGTILYVALADILPSAWSREPDSRFAIPIGVLGALIFMAVLAQAERHT